MKKFYYTGKNYLNATYTETYTRMGRWCRINYNQNGEPFFRHDNRRYYLESFIRCGSAWLEPVEITSTDGEKVSLAGGESDNYYKPIFIELSEGGEAVRVYQFEGTETDYT